MSKMDPRVVKTLHRIDNSLLENLKNHDFRKVTVDMLCRSAKINRSTFYKYYKDKYELLDSFLNRIMEEFNKATTTIGFILASPYTISRPEYLDDFRSTLDFIYERREIYKILWKSSIDRPIYREMEDIISQNLLNTQQIPASASASEKKEIAIYNELYARLFSVNFLTLVRWWLKNQPDITREDVEKVMTGNVKKGLLALKKQA